ncbi:hypothetical protein Tco_1129533, partial [Tanacetum coccineum]
VFTLDLRDLPHLINQTVNEVVKEAMHVALQAPLRDRFRELPEDDMKEILHQRMFENASSSSILTSDTREAPSSSSKQKLAPHSEQPVEDVPIPDDVNVSDSEDTDTAHLPKIKTRPDWLKPVLKEDRPATPEPDWVIPLNELPETENNWANALASSYQDPDEYKLLRQTSDMSSFINWFCKQIGKKKLRKAYLEGQAFKVVRPFHNNGISL